VAARSQPVDIDAEEFWRMLEGVVIEDAQVFNNKLREPSKIEGVNPTRPVPASH
jgi:hypothetical protein